jgi:hypothetical protein
VLKKFAVAIVLVLLGLAALIASRPAEFEVARSRVVAASPEVAYAYVNDLSRWQAWSPWETLDPTMTKEVSSPSGGVGATYHWSGNKDVGEGRMTITDCRTPQSVTIRLEFIKPWAATYTTRLAFEPSSAGTKVTWTMRGRNGFLSKAFGLFMDMGKMVGADFERGLANLDTVTAAAGKASRTRTAFVLAG